MTWVVLAGATLGGLGALLALLGNPANSGVCISCFLENLAGALGLHGEARMAYFRPELAGFVLGSMGAALLAREVKPRTGRLPLLGFVLGAFMIVGSSVFMGCPIKMALRLSAGDLTAVAGLLGLAAGVWAGAWFIRSGVDLGFAATSWTASRGAGGRPGDLPGDRRAGEPPPAGALAQALLGPGAFALLLLLALLVPGALGEGTSGPAALRAPVLLALGAGLVIGALAQRSRFCVTGSFLNWFLARDTGLLMGLIALLVTAAAVNLAWGRFHPGYLDQPGAHPVALWNCLGMGLTGFAAVLAGGCPFRQLVLMGEGLVDAGVVLLGMTAGGALVHLWGIASGSAGPTPAGKAAVLAGLLFCLLMARLFRRRA